MEKIWCFTWGGIVVIDPFGNTIDDIPNYLEYEMAYSDDAPTSIYSDQKGRIWAGTREALYVFKTKC